MYGFIIKIKNIIQITSSNYFLFTNWNQEYVVTVYPVNILNYSFLSITNRSTRSRKKAAFFNQSSSCWITLQLLHSIPNIIHSPPLIFLPVTLSTPHHLYQYHHHHHLILLKVSKILLQLMFIRIAISTSHQEPRLVFDLLHKLFVVLDVILVSVNMHIMCLWKGLNESFCCGFGQY